MSAFVAENYLQNIDNELLYKFIRTHVNFCCWNSKPFLLDVGNSCCKHNTSNRLLNPDNDNSYVVEKFLQHVDTLYENNLAQKVQQTFPKKNRFYSHFSQFIQLLFR